MERVGIETKKSGAKASLIVKNTACSWTLGSEKKRSSYARPVLHVQQGSVCVCVWWVLEKMREHKENTSISAQYKWEDGITDVPEAKNGKM